MDLSSDTSVKVMFGSIRLHPIVPPVEMMEKLWRK
jgi:hypothetical protein